MLFLVVNPSITLSRQDILAASLKPFGRHCPGVYAIGQQQISQAGAQTLCRHWTVPESAQKFPRQPSILLGLRRSSPAKIPRFIMTIVINAIEPFAFRTAANFLKKFWKRFEQKFDAALSIIFEIFVAAILAPLFGCMESPIFRRSFASSVVSMPDVHGAAS
jgi:hypothetical protein